ncbi:MAG: HAD family phosphatase [Proteobacteria bacterium]|nr:HAD family phosphatase [Pseudomonadota bacterium]
MNDILRAVIFDMDGVIVDSQPYHFAVEEKIFCELGFAVTVEESHSFVGMAGDRMWSYLKDKFGLKQSIEALMEFDNKIRADYFASLKNVNPVPGIIDLLDELKHNNIKTALASSSSVEVIEAFISKLNLEHYFQHIISGDLVERGKPDPDIFIHTARALNEKVSDCVVIEDSTNGVKAAKLAGMKCIGFKNPNSGDQDLSLADMVMDDLRKIDLHLMQSLFKD